MKPFQAFSIHDDGGHRAGIETIQAEALTPGEVLVEVAYSSVNFKDALAGAGGIGFESTVMPFIVRGASVLGIASAGTARAMRDEIWQRLASDWKPQHLERIATHEITLTELPDTFARMLEGESFGRTLVRIDPAA